MKPGIDSTHYWDPIPGKQSLVQSKLSGTNYMSTSALEMAGILADLDPVSGAGKQRVWHYNSQMYREWGKVGA
jgi:hypothetical protein